MYVSQTHQILYLKKVENCLLNRLSKNYQNYLSTISKKFFELDMKFQDLNISCHEVIYLIEKKLFQNLNLNLIHNVWEEC